jgi:acetyl-CoA carboxylase carboxyl transferase subunit alpha
LGGAHRDPYMMAASLKGFLRANLRELSAMPIPKLLEARYQKFRRMGVFLAAQEELEAEPPPVRAAGSQP